MEHAPLKIDGVRLATCRAELLVHHDATAWRRAAAFALWCQRNAPWWIGDLIVLGGERVGDEFWTHVPMDGASFDGLERWGGVARKVPVARRRSVLSWTHHAIVAGLPPSVQDRFLAAGGKARWARGQVQIGRAHV